LGQPCWPRRRELTGTKCAVRTRPVGPDDLGEGGDSAILRGPGAGNTECAPRLRSKTQLEMIGLGGRLCRRLGMPRITGQIYGLLFLAVEPLSLDDIVALLGVSKASASMGARQLQAWGAIRQTWAPGNRRDYYVVVEDLGGLLRSSYRDVLKPRLQASRRRLESLLAVLGEESAQGLITQGEFKTCAERLRSLCRLQKRFQAAAPLLERLL